MGELILPVADQHVGPACHSRMDRVVPQQETEYGIVRTRRHAADRIAGVDVLKIDLCAELFEMDVDLVTQEVPDVPQANVSGSIGRFGPGHQILSGALAHHDNRVVPRLKSILQRPQKALEGERDLGYQAIVDLTEREGSVGGDEP